MPRKKNETPTYRYYKPRNCGKAVFGKTPVYFPGAYQSPESIEAYERAVAEWRRTGLTPRQATATDEKTIAELIQAFWEQRVTTRYIKNGEPTTERRSFATALRPVRQLYGLQLISAFTPKCLIACQQKLMDAGYTRKRINQHVGRIRQMFKWGVPQELVHESTWRALQAVEGLRKGEGAKESVPVRPVTEQAIEAIHDFVTPPVWAMIQIQLWTGARPGEICQMRTCDIRRGDAELPAAVAELCHVYRPQSWKTEHHGIDRYILLGPQAIAIIEPWLRPAEPEQHLFSPAEAKKWYFAKRRAMAKTPRRELKTKPSPKRKPGEYYTESTYCNAIAKAIVKANKAEKVKAAKLGTTPTIIPHWHPNQLRHLAATRLRAKYKLEIARVILGHASAVTTEIYAEQDWVQAAKAIAESG